MKSSCRTAIVLTLAAIAAAPVSAVEDTAFWVEDGKRTLADQKRISPNTGRAKNVIFFVGDGMGVSTVTAARILQAQLAGGDGERNVLAFERLPYLALSKTYSANQQTSDSAPTMTAMIAGIKTNDGMIGIGPEVSRGSTDTALIEKYKVKSLVQMAEAAGLSTGIVSTARITHATPAAAYAHSSERNWERDTQVPVGAMNKDIASQLIDNFGGDSGDGDGIEVVLGGGRREFLPNTLTDPEDVGAKGRRADGRNLAAEYETKFNGKFVYDRAGFDAFDIDSGKRLLGLFEQSHMQYEHDRSADQGGEPSLAEMTEKAIEILRRNPKGFVLLVEAGRIDHAHHLGNAYRALTDTMALSDAVETAMKMTDERDTLIVTTADHSHVFTIAGYPKRGNPILGKVVEAGRDTPALALDGNPYTTVSYANGLGFRENSPIESAYGDGLGAQVGRFTDLSRIDTESPDFHQEALVPLSSETHAGEDVAIYAGGPRAHLFRGTREQNYIFYVMKYALGL